VLPGGKAGISGVPIPDTARPDFEREWT